MYAATCRLAECVLESLPTEKSRNSTSSADSANSAGSGRERNGAEERQGNQVAIVLAGLSALMYGAADFCGGLGTRKSPLVSVLAVSQLVGLVAALGASVLLGRTLPSGTDLAWGAISGVCGTAGLAALYTALATTVVAVASPVAAVIGAVVPVLLGVAAGERPGSLAWIGIGLAVPALVLLSAGPAGNGKTSALVRRAALLGAAAGIGFGLFFFAISRTSHASGLWPLVTARASTISIVALFALFSGRCLRPARAGIAIVLLSGVLDMGANIAFLLATRAGMLSTVAVVASLYPGPTVLLAWLVLRERLTPTRVLGLVLALAGVALLSV
jgi:drug/metabolite transporter (DMT)-like permease